MSFTKFILPIVAILVIVSAYVLQNGQINTPTSSPIISNVEAAPKALPGVPINLKIPSVGVDAAIESIGLTDGAVGVPKGPSTTAWFNLGPKPGEMGSAIITGHFGPWRNGAHSVFDNLSKIKIGDKVYVRDNNGQTRSFSVIDIKTYSGDAVVPEIFNKSDAVYLNIITCSGDWLANQKTYTQRLVVFTKADS